MIRDRFANKICDTFKIQHQYVLLLFIIVMNCGATISMINLSYLAYTVVECYIYIAIETRFYMVL